MTTYDDKAVAPVVNPFPPGAVDGPADPAGPVDPADADLLDESWTAPKRTSRVTVVLAAGLVAALGFAGGAYAQRSHDQGLTPVAATGRTGAGGFAGAFAGGQPPSGFPSGGFGDAGTGAGQAASGQAASGQAAAGQGGTAAASPPVVVGTVTAVDASGVTVKNFAGASVVVRVPATATVTTTGVAGLKVGSTVAVSGTKGADGSVTATSIVSRRAG